MYYFLSIADSQNFINLCQFIKNPCVKAELILLNAKKVQSILQFVTFVSNGAEILNKIKKYYLKFFLSLNNFVFMACVRFLNNLCKVRSLVNSEINFLNLDNIFFLDPEQDS
ncbi:hypothetical protein BpHYR1_037262 [Brachionus plicatilis]|uniref:Uncharacterized protein n=1 Tax=Brachionus plicatilis TaxID=10195 RepID=A0A3M7PXK0_BRAPC|nr:hypothetical protein BpHYR1_037262 [Brachionus plicatilis]